MDSSVGIIRTDPYRSSWVKSSGSFSLLHIAYWHQIKRLDRKSTYIRFKVTFSGFFGQVQVTFSENQQLHLIPDLIIKTSYTSKPLHSRVFLYPLKMEFLATKYLMEEQKKKLRALITHCSELFCLATSYFCLAAIVGVQWLNCGVRDVNRCIPLAIVTIPVVPSRILIKWIFQKQTSASDFQAFQLVFSLAYAAFSRILD